MLITVVLEEPLEYTKFVRPICLPSAEGSEDSVGSAVAGWGKDKNKDYGQKLKRAIVQIFSTSQCQDVMEEYTGFGQDLLCAVNPFGPNNARGLSW